MSAPPIPAGRPRGMTLAAYIEREVARHNVTAIRRQRVSLTSLTSALDQFECQGRALEPGFQVWIGGMGWRRVEVVLSRTVIVTNQGQRELVNHRRCFLRQREELKWREVLMAGAISRRSQKAMQAANAARQEALAGWA